MPARTASPGSRAPGRPGLLIPPTVFLLLLGAAAVLAIHVQLTVRRPDRALFTFDSAEYAIAGRQLRHTGVLATPFVHPAVLGRLPGPPFPLVTGHPLTPMLDALAFTLVGDEASGTLVPPGLCFIALVGLAVAFVRRTTGEPAVALLAGAGVALSPLMLHDASEGLSELPFAVAWTGALLLLWDLPNARRGGALGLCLGVAHLARPVIAPLLPVWLAVVAAQSPAGTRLRAVLWTLAGFAPFALALLAYKWSSTGSPFTESGAHLLLVDLAPGWSVGRLNCMPDPPNAWAWLAAHPGALLAKLVREAPRMAWASVMRDGAPVGLLALSYLFTPIERGERAFRLGVLALIATLVLLVSLTVPNPRYFDPLVPGLWALALTEAWRIARGARLGHRAAFALGAVIVVVCALWPTLRQWRDTVRTNARDRGVFAEHEWRSFGRVLREQLGPGLVVSDVAPWVSWYAGAPTVLLPNTPAEFAVLERRIPVATVVLSNEWVIAQPGSEAWRAVFEDRATLPGFVTQAVISAGRLRAKVLVRERQASAPASPPAPERRHAVGAGARRAESHGRLNSEST